MCTPSPICETWDGNRWCNSLFQPSIHPLIYASCWMDTFLKFESYNLMTDPLFEECLILVPYSKHCKCVCKIVAHKTSYCVQMGLLVYFFVCAMQLCGQPTLAADKDQEGMKNPKTGLCLHPKVVLSC